MSVVYFIYVFCNIAVYFGLHKFLKILSSLQTFVHELRYIKSILFSKFMSSVLIKKIHIKISIVP